MHVLVTCKYKKDWIKKQPRKSGDIIFPIISQLGLSVAMEPRVLITLPQNLMQLSPNSMMLHIKFDQDWQTGLRDILKFKSVKFSSLKGK